MRKNTIGFIGLGQMGLGMANNLARLNSPFYTHDRDREISNKVRGNNVIIAESVANLAKHCHLIF